MAHRVPRDLINLQIACSTSGIGYSTLRKYIATGRISAWRVGRELRVSRGALDRLNRERLQPRPVVVTNSQSA
jgi:excisionase family DNA binding protein